MVELQEYSAVNGNNLQLISPLGMSPMACNSYFKLTKSEAAL